MGNHAAVKIQAKALNVTVNSSCHTQKASIWATFREIPTEVKQELAKAGYETEDELLLYREITAESKSNCRINGMPATAAIIREVCSGLINIHGQHDNQSLMNPAEHLAILDAFAQNTAQHDDYYAVYHELCKVKREIDALSMDEDEKTKRIDLLRFQADEIDKADLKQGEEEELTNQRSLIRNAQRITEQLNAAYLALSGGDETTGTMENIAELSEDFAPISEKLNDLFYTARETASDLGGMLEGYPYDPRALEQLEERLDLLYWLKQKYAADIPGLLRYAEQAHAELAAIETGTERLDALYDRQTALYDKAKALANLLTQTRLCAFERFNRQIVDALQFLKVVIPLRKPSKKPLVQSPIYQTNAPEICVY